MELKEKINGLASKYFEEIVNIRRHLHMYPELSFRENETSAYIRKVLDDWGVPYKHGIAGTGIVATLKSGIPGKIIGLRADMDALPIREENDVPYKSRNEGVMHACGHDVHTACLLGALRIMQEAKEQWNGTIRFVFQPAEERVPGGAKSMLQEKAFGDEEPSLMIALHVYTDMSAGKVGFRQGVYMASSDEIFIKVSGKGGHGALPDKLIDPVLITAHLITSLQQIVSRRTHPGIPTVLSFGKIAANGSVNVIPDEVSIEGTFRTMSEPWRRQALELIRDISVHTAKTMGGKAEVEVRPGYPMLENDPAVTARAKELSEEFLGKANIENLDIQMTAEDFAYFAQKYPSVMFRLGTSDDPLNSPPLHTSRFSINENSIRTGMGLMAWLSIRFLEGKL